MSGKGWWNSAISGLESRLDTILAEDDQASAKSRAADALAKQEASEKGLVDRKLAVEPGASQRARGALKANTTESIAERVPEQTQLPTAGSSCQGCKQGSREGRLQSLVGFWVAAREPSATESRCSCCRRNRTGQHRLKGRGPAGSRCCFSKALH